LVQDGELNLLLDNYHDYTRASGINRLQYFPKQENVVKKRKIQVEEAIYSVKNTMIEGNEIENRFSIKRERSKSQIRNRISKTN